MDIIKLIDHAKVNGAKGFVDEFKAQYAAMTPKGKKIFWGVVAGIVLLVIACASGSSESEKTDYEQMKDDVRSAWRQADREVNGELKKSVEMFKQGSRDLQKGIDGLKGVSF